MRDKAVCAKSPVSASHKKRGPKAPKNLALSLFAVSAVGVVGVGR
jgi:hypothetical protein